MLEHIQIQFIHLTRPGGTTEMERSGMTLHFCLHTVLLHSDAYYSSLTV